ncbi:MAG: siderophore-interacting protein [Galactobacter sp.]
MPRPVTVADARLGVNQVPHLLGARLLTVSKVESIGPQMARVHLTGEPRDRVGAIPFLPWAAGDHVKLVIPTEDGEVVIPTVVNERANWEETVGSTRDYTIRTVDQITGTLVIDGVLHDHGPAGSWFINAKEGDRVGVMGPRGSHVYPPGYRHYILIGDETALPALGRWLDEPGLNAAVTVITVAEDADAYPFPAPELADVDAHHLVLPSGPERGPALAAELSSTLDASATPESVFVFAAGEAVMLKDVRRALKTAGHPRHAQHIDGYWRAGTVALDHHALEVDED